LATADFGDRQPDNSGRGAQDRRRGSIETAKRVRGYIFAIFERAIGECLIEDTINLTSRVAKNLKKTPVGVKQPTLTDVPSLHQLQQDIDNSTSRVAGSNERLITVCMRQSMRFSGPQFL